MCLMKQDWFTYKLTACINGSENSSVRPAMAHPSPVGCECRLVPFDWESFLPGFLQGLLNHCLLLSAKWAFKCQFVVSSLALCSLGNSEVDEPYAYKISSCILCGFFLMPNVIAVICPIAFMYMQWDRFMILGYTSHWAKLSLHYLSLWLRLSSRRRNAGGRDFILNLKRPCLTYTDLS